MLSGLDSRMKGAASLERKIESDAAEKGISLADAADGIIDALRYTYQCGIETFASDFAEVRADLESQGYNWVRVKNTLGDTGAAYRGVNTKSAISDGYEFELQFHTAESLESKEANHRLYDEQHVLDVSTPEGAARSRELEMVMAGNAESIETPPGIEGVGL